MTVVRGMSALFRVFCVAVLAVGLAFALQTAAAVGKARAAGYGNEPDDGRSRYVTRA